MNAEMSSVRLKELLSDTRDYFSRLIPGVQRLIADLRETPENCMTELFQACEGIAWVCSSLFSARSIHGAEIDVGYVNATQRSISEALRDNDYYHIADILENESLPLLTTWSDQLESMRRSESAP
jgi:hypothetical protein